VESEGESNTVGEAELVAVPEASLAKLASRWSKRHAGDTDEDSLKRASKLKAQHNESDNNPDPLSLNISDSCIQTNLSSVGIHLGQDSVNTNASLQKFKGAASVRDGKILSDKKLLVLEHELKELEQEEKLDKLLLNQLCSEIMEEVMDSGECNNELLIASSSRSRKKVSKNSKKKS
jgi:hypothetical protein